MASGITITEKGTKGLGNAWAGGAAVAEDASTIYWNPAGLTRLDSNRAEFSLHLIRPSFEFNNQGSTTVIPAPSPFNTLSGGDGGDAGDTNFVPNFFYSHDISEQWKAGVGIFIPFGLGTEYDSTWVGRYHTTKSEMLTVDINPTVAYRINSQWSVGGGISAQYIDADLRNAVDFGTINAALGFGLPILPQGADGAVKLTGDDWSFGFNLGVLFELSDETRFGLAYRSKISHEVDGDAKFTTPTAAQPLATFLGLVNTDVSADIDLPANIALSGYHQLNEKWAIMATVIWTDWSVLDELRIDFDSPAADNVITLKWDDSYYYAIGATWFYSDRWTFRGGLAFDETPVPNSQLRTPRVPDDNRIWISAGGSYQISDQWDLDFAGTYITTDGDAEINKTATGEDTFRGGLKGDYDAWSYLLSAQINYRF
jgi:long-chain fatty acid transport protein